MSRFYALRQWFARLKNKNMFAFVAIFALIGTILLLGVYAAVSTASIEPEDGQLSSGASSITDATASKGKAVKFDATVAPPPVGGHIVNVATADQLKSALATAKPGDVITMADGTYTGTFNSTVSGTSTAAITLKGGRNAIINGGGLSSGYTFSLGAKNSPNKVSFWRLEGFTITGGQKGLIFDNVQRSIINNLYVHQTGQEGVHLRNNSSDNIISNNTVTLTGRDQQAYGEGIYIGSAVSNWDTFSQNAADRSNNNQIISNTISKTGAESIDIKEGTHNGLIKNNHFDGTGMCWDLTESCNYGDSWLDMKGQGWQITDNTGIHLHAVWENGGATNDGFQNHVISGGSAEGSGNDNIYSGNKASDVGGYGFNIQKSSTGVVVKCNNTVTGAGQGFGNVTCTN